MRGVVGRIIRIKIICGVFGKVIWIKIIYRYRLFHEKTSYYYFTLCIYKNHYKLHWFLSRIRYENIWIRNLGVLYSLPFRI